MEKSNSWRNPIDFFAVLEDSFEELPETLEDGRGRRENGPAGRLWCRFSSAKTSGP
jgi:hypothetical protein